MTGWPCPRCERDLVCSLREWRAVYRPRQACKRRGPRRVASALQSYGVAIRPEDDALDACLRWLREGLPDAPGYICPRCVEPFRRREVRQA